MVCANRQLSQAQREAGFDQQRAGVRAALRPFTGAPTVENLIDYINRELGPLVRQARDAVNDIHTQVVDNAPSANPLGYYFATDTTNADPTDGRLRLNQAVQNTATVIRVSQNNAQLQDVTPWLDVMSGGPTTPLGTVTLTDAVNPGRFLRFDLNTMTDQGVYWDLGVTIIESSHASPFVDEEGITLGFIPGVSAAGSTVPVGSLSPVATDTFLGNISGSTAAPSAVPLADIDSTSIVYDAASHTFQRGALTGAVVATQNSNATLFAGILDNGAAENDRQNLNFVSSTSVTMTVTDDSGNNELEITPQRAALTGAIAASANANTTVFSGIRDNGSAENDRTNLNWVDGTSIFFTITDDAGGDELEIRAQRAALTGAVSADIDTNATLFAGILDNGGSRANRTNLNFIDNTSVSLSVTDDAGNNELEIQATRAALTGEVTASLNSNALTVTRSTDFDTSPWTGNHQFDGQFALGTITTDSSTGSINVTLGASSTRLVLSGTGTITVGTISGCAEGRVLFGEFTGTGTHTISHDASTANAVSCPGNENLRIDGRGGFILVGRSGTANWKCIAVAEVSAGRLISRTTYTSGSGTHTYGSRTRRARVRGKGGGGGGGGAGTADGNVGSGGGEGGYFELDITSVPASSDYEVGAGGTAGASSPDPGTAGGDGGDTTFDDGSTTRTAGGGGGGQVGGVLPEQGTGGSAPAVGGTVAAAWEGAPGGFGHFNTAITVGWGGNGGGSGAGKGGNASDGAASEAGAAAGANTGAGGGGASRPVSPARAGGAGGSGYIVVEEYT